MNRLFKHILLIFALALTTQWAEAQTENHFYHTVTKGQGLYSIARMYGVTEAEIIELNPGSEEIIKVGEKLRIPQSKKVQDIVSPESQTSDTGEQFHTIKTGETLYRLTVIYGLTAREICNANPGLSAENFKAGQVIIIPEKKVEEQVSILPAVEPIDTIEKDTSNCRTEHIVKRKENIYRISRMYGISELELITANPELRERKVRKGETLCIPYSQSELDTLKQKEEEQAQLTENEVPDTIVIPTNEELFAELKTTSEGMGQIKVAVILPVLLDSVSTDQKKMIEFYEGILMALDTLKREGVSVDLHMYDSGGENKSLSPILNTPEMSEMNLIIGPVYGKHIAEVADFAKAKGIHTVLPFARKVDEVFTNPYLFQVNTPQSYFYSDVYENFLKQFPNPNIIFFESARDGEDHIIADFKREMTERGVPHTTMKVTTYVNSSALIAKMDTAKHNILMMTSEKIGSLNTMMPSLQVFMRSSAAKKRRIHLFGYPQYQTYTTTHLAGFYELDTYFYSSFYANNLNPRVKEFHKAFYRTYSKEITNRFPKYAILGYDLAYYFLKAIHLYGADMDSRLSEMQYTPIQTGFKFERVNNWGGFINHKVFFVHFSKDHKIETIDFD